jgi:hypothetical protein
MMGSDLQIKNLHRKDEVLHERSKLIDVWVTANGILHHHDTFHLQRDCAEAASGARDSKPGRSSMTSALGLREHHAGLSDPEPVAGTG